MSVHYGVPAYDIHESSSVAAAKRWKVKYVPKEGLPGSDPLSANLTFRFVTRTGDKIDDSPGKWRTEWRTPDRAAPWAGNDSLTGVASAGDDSIRLATPFLKLRDGIVDTTL